MDISKKEAEETLDIIRSISNRTKTSIANGGAYYLILWGIIWFFGFLGNQFIHSSLIGFIWMGLNIVGTALSIYVGKRIGGQVKSQLGKLLFQFWIAIFIFTVVAVVLIIPFKNYVALSMMVITMVMLGYTIMGFLTNIFLSYIGISVTVVGLVSYLLFPQFFGIIMAFLGGGTLIVSGIYMLKKWKLS